jgi:hypothetical protein
MQLISLSGFGIKNNFLNLKSKIAYCQFEALKISLKSSKII